MTLDELAEAYDNAVNLAIGKTIEETSIAGYEGTVKRKLKEIRDNCTRAIEQLQGLEDIDDNQTPKAFVL